MARAILTVSLDLDLARTVKTTAKQWNTTESRIVSDALRAYFATLLHAHDHDRGAKGKGNDEEE